MDKRTEELIRRYRAAGLPINDEQAGARFSFLASSYSSPEAETNFLVGRFTSGVYRLIKSHAFASPISGIAIFVIITGPAIQVAPDYIKISKSDNIVRVGRRIDYTQWMEATSRERVSQYANSLVDAIALIGPKRLFMDDSHVVQSAVREVEGDLNSTIE